MTKEKAQKTAVAGEAVGILVYLGTTGVGKTYKALEDLRALHRKGKRCVIIDSARVENFEKIPHVDSLEGLIRECWGNQQPCFVAWTPDSNDNEENVEEFDAFLSAAMEAGDVAILIDELSFWVSKPRSRVLPTLCRVWRHSRVTLLVTCQHVGMDLAQTMLACNPRLYIFRTTAPRSLEWIMRHHGIDPGEVRALPDRKFVEKTF